MLRLLLRRCHRAAPSSASRVELHHAEALTFVSKPRSTAYDLVVTHFFLDCLTQQQVEALVCAVTQSLTPGALWLVSDFHIPATAMRLPATLLVRGLYLAFRILTGLRTRHLPEHALALERAGFTRVAHQESFFGLLLTELWSFSPTLDHPHHLHP
jgi:hypothetical protein